MMIDIFDGIFDGMKAIMVGLCIVLVLMGIAAL